MDNIFCKLFCSLKKNRLENRNIGCLVSSNVVRGEYIIIDFNGREGKKRCQYKIIYGNIIKFVNENYTIHRSSVGLRQPNHIPLVYAAAVSHRGFFLNVMKRLRQSTERLLLT